MYIILTTGLKRYSLKEKRQTTLFVCQYINNNIDTQTTTKMDSELKVNMFVAVCKSQGLPTFITMNDIAEELFTSPRKNLDRFTLTKIVPKYKGRLDQICGLKDPIGSISLSVNYCNRGDTVTKFNLLIFKNCVRISGGVSQDLQDDIHDTISEEPIKEFCKLLMLALYYWTAESVKCEEVKLVNVNAIYRREPIPRYFEFCQNKLWRNVRYDRVILPLVFETGAIATCHVYPLANKNCSAKLTHTGVVQFMGFQEVDMLHVFAEMIKQDINM
jgi:hypothetical protein